MSRKEYAAAEARLKESIKLRREGLPHTYPRREEDLEVMRRTHEQLGEIPPERGFFAWWRRVLSGRG